MTNLFKVFKSKQFILFILIGVINTFNGVVFSTIYSLLFNANISFILGYISGLIISYLLNSFITFKERLSINKFLKFVISYIPNFIIQNTIVIILYNMLAMNKILVYLIAAIIGVPITFIFMKLFAFKKMEDKN